LAPKSICGLLWSVLDFGTDPSVRRLSNYVFNTPTKCAYNKIYVLIINFSPAFFGSYCTIFRGGTFFAYSKIFVYVVIT
jgi:hypothetical protein